MHVIEWFIYLFYSNCDYGDYEHVRSKLQSPLIYRFVYIYTGIYGLFWTNENKSKQFVVEDEN